MAAEERARKLGLTDEELDNFLEDAETAAENVVWKMRLARTEGRAPLPDAQIETLIDEALGEAISEHRSRTDAKKK